MVKKGAHHSYSYSYKIPTFGVKILLFKEMFGEFQ